MVNYHKLWIRLIEEKMTKAQLQKSANISKNGLKLLEKNKVVPSEMLLRICNVLDCQMNDILESDGENESITKEPNPKRESKKDFMNDKKDFMDDKKGIIEKLKNRASIISQEEKNNIEKEASKLLEEYSKLNKIIYIDKFNLINYEDRRIFPGCRRRKFFTEIDIKNLKFGEPFDIYPKGKDAEDEAFRNQTIWTSTDILLLQIYDETIIVYTEDLQRYTIHFSSKEYVA